MDIAMRPLHPSLVIAALMIFILSTNQCDSSRVPTERAPASQSLQKDLNVPPSGHNGCTYIPNRGGAPCVIEGEGAFVDRVMSPPRRLLPDPMVPSSANLK
ncbi:hypothetical protein V6N13_079437 [Hibiscus sabdariffa]|uniref:Uncharacterized protein n=1 Tax=Hibiscus sabdariffa TaxID=183260 RepID=A0ABR2RRE3_9ROSI